MDKKLISTILACAFCVLGGARAEEGNPEYENFRYRVAYSGNGGTNETGNIAFTNEYKGVKFERTQTIASNVFTRVGYAFVDWCATNGWHYGEGELIASNLTLSTDIPYALAAQWTNNSYCVSFDANGGAGNMERVACKYDVPQVLPPNEFVLTGYVLGGWTNETGSILLSNGGIFSNLTAEANGNVTLFAKWEKDVSIDCHAVTNGVFDGEVARFPAAFAGTFEMTHEDDHVITFTAPASGVYRVSVDFPDEREETVSLSIVSNGVTTLETTFRAIPETAACTCAFVKGASYSMRLFFGSQERTKEYVVGIGLPHATVKFKTEETLGTLRRDCSTYDYTVGYPYGYLPTPTPRGTTFLGWFTAATGGERRTTNSLARVDETILYAHWQFNYDVKFHSNDGQDNIEVQALVSDTPAHLAQNVFVRNGYRFCHWTNVNNEVFADGACVTNLATVPVDVNLYAVWSNNTYTVAYTNDTGDVASQEVLFTNDVAACLLSTNDVIASALDRVGYHITGWWDVSNKVARMPGACVTNLTFVNGALLPFVAQWAANDYCVRFEANGGVGVMANQALAYDSPATLTANAFSRLGFSFAGWATNQTDGIVRYADSASVTNLESVAGSTNTLYAVWTNDSTIASSVVDLSGGTSAATNGLFGAGTRTLFTGMLSGSGQPFLEVTNGAAAAVLRMSLDPGSGGVRVGQKVSVYALPDTSTPVCQFSDLTTNVVCSFQKGVAYRFVFNREGATADYAYQLGIGLTGFTFRFDPTTGGLADDAVSFGTNFTFTVGTPYGYQPAVTNPGKVLTGWFDQATDGMRYESNNVVSAVSPRVLYAQWAVAPFQYVVAFTNAAPADQAFVITGAMTNEIHTYDQAQSLTSNAFKRVGYDFSGWYDAQNARLYGDGDAVSNLVDSANCTNAVGHVATNILSAVWNPVTYKVAFDANGGSGVTMPEQVLTYDTPVTLTPNRYLYAGKIFKGWALRETATDVAFADCACVTNLTAESDGTVPLYAVWETDPFNDWYVVRNETGVTNSWTNVCCTAGRASAFSGLIVSNATDVFYMTATGGVPMRVSLDPRSGLRTGATLDVDMLSNETWVACASVPDFAPAAITNLFQTNRTYRFTVKAPSTNYAYVVGLGFKGVDVHYHLNGGSLATNETHALAYNFSEGYPFGYMPDVAFAANASFVGWFDNPINPNNTGRKFSADDLVSASDTDLYAGWTGSASACLVTFNWNLGESPERIETNCVPFGTKFSIFPEPVTSNRSFVGWSTFKGAPAECVEIGYHTTDSVITNASVALYGQWSHFMLSAHDNKNWTVEGYYGTVPDQLELPDQIGIRAPNYIGTNAFLNCDNVTSVSLPIGFSTVFTNGFKGCTGIRKVTGPVSQPFSYMFPDAYRAIATVVVPVGVKEICDDGLKGCVALTDFTFPTAEVEETAETGFLDDEGEITIGESAFEGCTSLETLALPLGVFTLPTRFCADCTALTTFQMPYTVKTIGDEAFSGCSALVTQVVTEHVTELGDLVFSGCKQLKAVNYLGNRPDASENIYSNANAQLHSGFLSTASGWTAGEPWPRETDTRKQLVWDTEIDRCTITFNYNNGNAEIEKIVCVKGRVLGSVMESDPTSGSFVGWFSKAIGGTQFYRYTSFTAACTLYAHWSGGDSGGGDSGGDDEEEEDGDDEEEEDGDDEEEEEEDEEDEEHDDRTAVGWDESFYADDDVYGYYACTFDGYLLDGDGNVGGIITVVAQKGKAAKNETGQTARFKATVQLLGVSKKIALSGTIDAEGNATASAGSYAFEATMTKLALEGTFELTSGDDTASYTVHAARNRHAAAKQTNGAASDARYDVRMAIAAAKGTWNMILSSAEGYSTLTVIIASTGKAKITGVLADGTRVSVTSTLIVGDGCCCLPVLVPLYSGKKGGFACALWFTWQDDMSFDEGDYSVQGLSDWKIVSGKTESTTSFDSATLVYSDAALAYSGTGTFEMSESFDLEWDSGFSPDGTVITITSKKFSVPKNDKVKFVDGAWENQAEESANPASLKLTYTPTTGVFKGSFKVYGYTSAGKAKTYTATVNGVFIPSSGGYGSAVIKNVGSVPITISLE